MNVLSESVSQSVSVSNTDEVNDKVNDEVNDEDRLTLNGGPLLAGAEGAEHDCPARGAGIL